MNATTVLTSWADRWRHLRAWRAALPMQIQVLPYDGGSRLGEAWSRGCRAVIYQTGDLAADLATVLHEQAHLAAPDATSHGEAWRVLFARSVEEAFGLPPLTVADDVDQADLDAQATLACRRWLRTSGQRDFLRALGVKV